MKIRPNNILAAGALGSLLFGHTLIAAQPDPYAANNTLYPPPQDWTNGFRASNYDYPSGPVKANWRPGGPHKLARGGLTKKTAPAYVAAVKSFIQKDMEELVNDPLHWSPEQAGWYDMPWGGQGSIMANGEIDPESGRESLLGSYTGQILQPNVYPTDPPTKEFQNHAVVYYNEVAASMLGKVWHNVFKPDVSAAQFPEGSIVVKVEGVTLTPSEWSPVEGSSISYIYRPTTATLKTNGHIAEIVEMRFLQMAVRIKDRVASPDTGWVFIAFAYDKDAKGTVWDKATPVGAMWGNDPEYARTPNGVGPDNELQETWVNNDPSLPTFFTTGLGWGGRLAGPLDVGVRHNVVTVSGVRPESFPASSCVSCHGSAQYPFVANLYPSPNMVFPEEGQQFLFFDPGSAPWAKWFQNRRGNQPMSGRGHNGGIVAIDYDMMLTFALMQANGSAGTEAFIRHGLAGH